MKNCPKCGSALTPKRRHTIEVDFCDACQGMWLDRHELAELEDKTFSLGDDSKGTMVTNVTQTAHKCPTCGDALKAFQYRFYDLKIEICEKDGFWLDRDEDKRVLEHMKREQSQTKRSVRAEREWSSTLKRMRSRSFIDRLREFLK